MKNELGDIPKVSLEDEELTAGNKKVEVVEELQEDVIKPEEEMNNEQKVEPTKFSNNDLDSNKNYYTKKDKFNRTLTIILVASITIAVLILIGFGVKKLIDTSNARKAEEEHKKQSGQVGIEQGPGETGVDGSSADPIITDNKGVDNTQSTAKTYYKGFEVVGYVRIPRTSVNYPILKPMTNKSLEASVALEHTMSGVNKPGNTTISGHNYRNDQFFANNYRIQMGDPVYVKDMSGRELKYTVYDIKEVGENDKTFVQRNTNGGIEVTLSTCTDNVVNRIVIFAKHTPEQQ